MQLDFAGATQKRLKIGGTQLDVATKCMVEQPVAAREPLPDRYDSRGQGRRSIVEYHDVRCPRGEVVLEGGREPYAYFESVRSGGVLLPIEEDADVDVAVRVRPLLGEAAEEINRDDARIASKAGG